jgi:hypothetical protein
LRPVFVGEERYLLVPVVLLGLFDMPPLEELPELPEEPLLPLEEPVLLEPVLLGECEELDEPPAALPEDPWDALYSSRLSLPSWSLSSWSKDLLLLDDDPPEAALLSDDEPELLLCDMDGDLELVLLDCFDESAAYADAVAKAAREKASAMDFSCMNYLLVVDSIGTRVRARQ